MFSTQRESSLAFRAYATRDRVSRFRPGGHPDRYLGYAITVLWAPAKRLQHKHIERALQ